MWNFQKYILLLWLFFCSRVFGKSLQNKSVSFELEPIKERLYQQLKIKPPPFCIIFRPSFLKDIKSNIFLDIEISDIINHATNVDRFGGTSDSRGKQSIEFTLKGFPSGNILRHKRNFPNGISTLEINPHKDTAFEACFINFVYDGSWSSIDLTKSIKITYWSYLVELRNKKRQQKKELTVELSDVIDGCLQEMDNISQLWDTNNLFKYEQEHRNINESTFSLQLYSMILFAIVVVSSNVILLQYIRRFL